MKNHKLTAAVMAIAMMIAMSGCDSKKDNDDLEVRRKKVSETKKPVETEPEVTIDVTTTESTEETTEATTTTEETTTEATTTEATTEATTTEATTTTEAIKETKETTEATTTTEATKETTTAQAVKEEPTFIRFNLTSDSRDYTNFDEELNLVGARMEVDRLTIEANQGYDELQKNVDEFMTARYLNYVGEFENNEKEAKANEDGYGEFLMSNVSHTNMIRSDSDVVSFYCLAELDMGGVHPTTMKAGSSFDSKMGKLLIIDDIVNDTEAFHQKVLDAIEKHPNRDMLYEEYKDYVKTYFDDTRLLNFYVTYSGVRVVFNPYELAPYSAGYIEVDIPYAGNESLYKVDYWSKIPHNRILRLEAEYDPETYALSYVTETDTDGDGKTERYSITPVYGDYWFETLDFYVDGNKCELQRPEYDYLYYGVDRIYDVYLLIKDGKKFIYVSGSGMDDWHGMMAFALEGGKVNELEEPYDKNGFSMPTVKGFVDPDYFYCDDRSFGHAEIDVIGSKIADNGQIVVR